MAEGATLDDFLGRMARDELPWDKAWAASFNAFADRFTLHDSAWVGVFLNVREDAEAVLAFHWDPHWLPPSLAAVSREAERGWDGWATGLPFLLLFIRVSQVASVRLSGYDEPIGGRGVGDA